MKKVIAIITALVLCMSALSLPAAFAETVTPEPAAAAVTAVSPAFQTKVFTDLFDAGKLIPGAGMELSKESGKNGLVIKGKPGALSSGRIVIDEDFNFSEKPEGRKTDVMPVGRISADGLSDKKAKVRLNIYLDDEAAPRMSMLLRRQMGKIGWTRKGDMTQDVLAQNITGKHRVSIGFEIENADADKKTTVLLRSITFCENSLPVMYFDIDESEGSIDSMNASVDHSAECYGSVTLQVPAGYKGEFSDKELKSTGPLELEYIRGRGNSTWDMDKKPYKVKLDKKKDLLGMGENKHWVLLANRYDNSLLRNRITYWIVRQMGMEFAIKCAPVEVVMNGDYYGSYLLSQQVRVGKTRVEIDELDEKAGDPDSIEITGGYLVNMGGYDEEDESSFVTNSGHWYEIESPDFEDYPIDDKAKAAKDAQRKYIADYFNTVEGAVFGKDMKDADGNPYTKYMDEQSAADFWWIQEFSMNGDAFGGGSNYLYKKRDTAGEDGTVTTGKLYWGPLWDFDYVAWGNPNSSTDTEGFDNTSNEIMKKLRTSEEFTGRLKARWSAEQDKEHLNDAHLDELINEVTKEGGVIDQYRDEVCVSEYYDYAKYGFLNEGGGYSSYAGTNWEGPDGEAEPVAPAAQDEEPIAPPAQNEEPMTYDSEVEQLRSWIRTRQTWVSENLQDIGSQLLTVRFIIDGKVVDTRQYIDGQEYGSFPEVPEKKDYKFTGWYDENGERIFDDECAWRDCDLTAKYVKTNSLIKPKNIYFRYYDVYTFYSTYDDEDNTFYTDYIVMPENAAESKIKWSVSDPSIAEVNEEGEVRAKNAGTVKVTAKLPSGKKNSFNITFLPYDVEISDIEKISFKKKNISLKAGSYTQLRTSIQPKQHYHGDMNWFTMDPKIAVVDDYGIIRAKKPGKTIAVVLDSESRRYAVCNVTVTATKAYKIKTAKAAKVTGVKAKAVKAGGRRAVRVSWKKKSGVSGYYVLRSTKKSGKYKKAGTVKKAKTKKWTDKKVSGGKTYYYKVQPYTKVGKKTYKGKMSAAAFARTASA